jgi:GNAT superfamily N-acetyltransferase
MDHVFCRRFLETALMNKPMTHSDGSSLYLSEVVQAAPRPLSALDRENGSPTYGILTANTGLEIPGLPDHYAPDRALPARPALETGDWLQPVLWESDAVDDGYLGLGIGSRLLEQARAFALRKHWSIWLLVDERNRAAIRLYERLGYRIIGRDGAQYRMLWKL